MTADHGAGVDGEAITLGVADARLATAYLLARESDEYIAVMEVLETSVNDLTPAEVATALRAAGLALEVRTVQDRLDSLRRWTAVSARSDTSRVLRYEDLMSRNWRYTASPIGRQVQRFYRTVLAGTQALREIPLSSLARIVGALDWLAAHSGATDAAAAEQIGRLFTSHDDLDGALVGAEDVLTGLADRFDLDTETTAELKEMLVNYATRVAAELERGAALATAALQVLGPRFGDLAAAAVNSSDARELIDRGALSASRGGRVADWEGLQQWFGPDRGRAARFAFRLVRALPGMHANLRRLHTSGGAASSRARALVLARACADPENGTAIMLAALGDHSWRKLKGAADDDELTRNPPWRDGPDVEVPDLLRATGRTGSRGRTPAARDDTEARAVVAARRSERLAAHADALAEVLAAEPDEPGQPRKPLSDAAARLAYGALMSAVRAQPIRDRRTAELDGLGCTVWHTGAGTGELVAQTWRVLLPGRLPVFHRRGTAAARPAVPLVADPGGAADLTAEAEGRAHRASSGETGDEEQVA